MYIGKQANTEHTMLIITDIDPPPMPVRMTIIDETWTAPPQPPAPVAKAANMPAAQAVLVDPRIAEGVAAMITAAPERDPAPNRQQGLQEVVYGSEVVARFGKDFTAAKVPSCGGADPLKYQPARIGPVGLGDCSLPPSWWWRRYAASA